MRKDFDLRIEMQAVETGTNTMVIVVKDYRSELDA